MPNYSQTPAVVPNIVFFLNILARPNQRNLTSMLAARMAASAKHHSCKTAQKKNIPSVPQETGAAPPSPHAKRKCSKWAGTQTTPGLRTNWRGTRRPARTMWDVVDAGSTGSGGWTTIGCRATVASCVVRGLECYPAGCAEMKNSTLLSCVPE